MDGHEARTVRWLVRFVKTWFTSNRRGRVYEGETVVIAGLLQDRVVREDSRVPVLGDIPGLGRLFHRSKEVTRKTDLVVLLTPTLLTPAEVAGTPVREQGTVFRTARP